jgi:hypothetical protein
MATSGSLNASGKGSHLVDGPLTIQDTDFLLGKLEKGPARKDHRFGPERPFPA